MKTSRIGFWAGTVAGCLFLYVGGAIAQDKPIRLRNETVHTTPLSQPAGFAPTASAANRTFSGLFLIQFTGRTTPQVRKALRQLGVELVSYVPADAFVAQADLVTLDQLRSIPEVRWAGDYAAPLKIHAALSLRMRQGQPGEEMAISLLLSPKAKPTDVGTVENSLQSLERAAHLRFGTILRGKIAKSKLATLAASPAVLWVEPAPRMQLYDEVSSQIVAGDGTGHNTVMSDLGYDGSGVTVAVADSGLDTGNVNDMHPDIAGRVRALFYYGGLTDAADEHSHGTHCAGIIAGNGATGETDEDNALYGLGVAPGASLVAQRIFDGVGAYEAPPSLTR